MSVLNRSPRRLASAAVVGALGIAIALGTTACSSGHIAQTATMEPAVNGAAGTIELTPTTVGPHEVMSNGSIAIRNAHVLYPTDKAEAVFGDGGPFKVAFLIANDSPTRVVKLDGITTKTGTVKITPPADAKSAQDPTSLRPTHSLQAGEPTGSITAADGTDTLPVTRLDVELNDTGKTVAAGLTVPLTFNFSVYDLTGKKVETVSTTVLTPVDGSPLVTRQDVIRDRQGESGGH